MTSGLLFLSSMAELGEKYYGSSRRNEILV